MNGTKTDTDFAWEILNLIFRVGDYYIDTEVTTSDGESRLRLCIDGTDYRVTEEQIAWLEKTFWADDPE